MAGVVAGNGLGLFNTSLRTMGDVGVLGYADVLGQAGGAVFVNAATGNLVVRALDEVLSGRGPDLIQLRTHNSLGGDWRLDGERTVALRGNNGEAGSVIVLTGDDGHETRYAWNGSRYAGTEGGGAHDTITYDSGPQLWQWIEGSSRLMEKFSAATGRLVSRHDSSGNGISFQYDASGRLNGVTDPASQQRMTMTYAPVPGNPNLTRMQRLDTQTLTTDAEGRATSTLGAPITQVRYGYDTDGRLTTVTTDLTPSQPTDSTVYTTSYAYAGTSSRIGSITQSDGTTASFGYDSAGRIKTVTDANGTQTFGYTDVPATGGDSVRSKTDMAISAADGVSQTWTMLCDATQRLVGIETPAPAGQTARSSTRFVYDAEGNLTGITDPRGNQMTCAYDTRGNRTLERDALGNTTESTFDDLNQITTQTRYQTPDPDGAGTQSAAGPVTTRFVYDSQSRSRFTISPEGIVGEQRYGTTGPSLGLVTQLLGHNGNRYDVSALAPSTALTETQLTSWVSQQDKTRTRLTRFDYDLRGNLDQRTDFAHVDASGAGLTDAAADVLEYISDGHGRLLKSMVVRGAKRDHRTIVASGSYDGLGRVLRTVDRDGIQVKSYDAANHRIQLTTATGLTHAEGFDDRGRMITVDQTDGGTTRTDRRVYDPSGRLRMTEDAQGGKRFRFYDAANLLQYTVDALGGVTGFEHDATGQATSQTRYATLIATGGWYDTATGKVVKNSLRLGTDITVDAARDRVTRYEYDAANRVTATTDEAGIETRSTFDGLSRVVQSRTGDRVTRFVHDRDGRVLGELDPLGFLTEYRYDAAGRLIETLRYRNRSPAAVNTEAPIWVGVTNQTVIAGQAFLYRLPVVDADDDRLVYQPVGSVPAWLTLESGAETARLTGTPPAVPAVYRVTLRVSDRRGKTTDVSIDITTVNSGPVWSSLADHVVSVGNTDYSLVLPQALDNEPGTQLTYSLRSSLPAGLSFDAVQRTVRGTPTQPGSYAIAVRVTDSRGLFADATFTLTVVGTALTWVRIPSLAVGGGRRFSLTVPPALGPADMPLTYSAIDMPGWLGFDPETRLLSGIPLPSGLAKPAREPGGSGPVTLRAHSPLGESIVLSFVLEVVSDEDGPRLPQIVQRGDNAITLAMSTVDEILTTWRPKDIEALHTYRYYDERERVVAMVDDKGFLSETVYDAEANNRKDLRYLKPAAVVAADTPETLRVKNGGAHNSGLIEYDDFGRASRLVFTDGSLTRDEYDAAGRLVREIAAAGTDSQRAIRSRLDAFSQVTGALDGTGEAGIPANPSQADIDAAITAHGMRHEYDSLGRTARLIDPFGNATLFFYDAEDRRSHTINAEGEITQTEYNRFGQAESQRLYANRMTPSNLNGLTGGPAAQLDRKLPAPDDAADTVTRYAYDRRGLLVSQTDGEGAVTTRTHTPLGQVAAETRTIAPGRTVTARFDYDLRGGLVSRSDDADGANFTVQMTIDAFGRVVTLVDPAGQVSTTSYRDRERAIESTDALGRKVRTVYESFGRVHEQVDMTRQHTTFRYNDRARTQSTISPEGVTVTTRKNEHGQALSITDGRDGITAYQYNANGQLTTVTDALGQIIRTNNYDAAGRLLDTTDPQGAAVGFGYDHAGRVTQRHSKALNQTTTYAFNALGQQVTVTEGAGSASPRVTSHRYDRNGRLLQTIVDPGGLNLSTRYTYDGLGNAVTVEQGTTASPKQQVTRYTFDKLGRRVRQVVAPSADVGAGTPRTRDLTTQYRYDAAGRLCRTIDAGGNSTWNVYDAAGQKTHVINAEGEVLHNTYDVNARLSHIRRCVNRLGTDVLGSFGDVAPAVVPAADPGDQRQYFVYDNDGRMRFTLTAAQGTDWTISENRHDAGDNIIESRRYDKFVPETRINAIDTTESPGISVADVTAELTALGYDGTDAALAKVQRTRFAYDVNNRRRFTVDASGAVLENQYDSAGNIVSAIRYAAKPALTSYTEAAIDAALDRTDPGDQATRYAYDGAGRLRFSLRVQARDAQGTATQHLVSEQSYDILDQKTRTTGYATVVGTLADYETDTIAAAVTAAATDRHECGVNDAAGRQVYRIRVLTPGAKGEHLVTKLDYDAFGQIIRSTAYAKPMGLADFTKPVVDKAVAANLSPLDRSTSFVYDPAGRRRFVVAADGTLGETVYDAMGQVLEQRRFAVTVAATTARTEAALTASRGNRVIGDNTTRGQTFSYDKVGRVLTVADAKGSSETNVYNGLGDLLSHTDKNGDTCVYQYDRQGRVTHKISPPVPVFAQTTGQVTITALTDRTSYDAFGNRISVEERYNTDDARTTEYVYDTLGRLTGTLLPGYYHPDAARVVKDPGTGFDSFRREVRIGYDVFGNPVSTATRTGLTSFQHEYKTYDLLGREAHDIDALCHVTAFAYTPFGEQRQVTRYSVTIAGAPANTTHWTIAEIAAKIGGDAKARTVTVDYDNAGRKIQVRQPSANYYHGHRLPQANAATVPVVSAQAATRYQYNAFGDLRREAFTLNATQSQDTWRYFDAMSREIRQIDALNHHTAHDYDGFGNLARTVEFAAPGNPGGTVENPPGVVQNDADRITAYTYDVLDQQISVVRMGLRFTRFNGSAYEQVNNGRDVPTTVGTTGYDATGKVVTQTDAAGNVSSFAYNALGQVIQLTEPSRSTAGLDPDPFRAPVTSTPVTTLTLDAHGNIVSQTRQPGGGLGQPLTSSQRYDVAGNVIGSSDPRRNETARFYDFAGRVIRETQAINATLGDWLANIHTLERRYVYDASGHQTDALDVFTDGATKSQSGQRSVYNAFGEVVEDRRVFGAASAPVTDLSSALAAAYDYDNAGHLISQSAAGGVSTFRYNLAGQVTRQELRPHDAPTTGAAARITETGYDELSRARLQRLPSHAAEVRTVGIRGITPLLEQQYDRWGNVTSRTTGGFVVNGEPPAPIGSTLPDQPATVTYTYDADNRLTAERLPVVADPGSNAPEHLPQVRHELRYDVLGRVVQECDLWDDVMTTADEANLLRLRSKRYNEVGQQIAETDATGVTNGCVYDGHGNRIAERNALGIVTVDAFDANGNLLLHRILRRADGNPYRSGIDPVGLALSSPVINMYRYDQANRRIGSADVNLGEGVFAYINLDERGFVRAERSAARVIVTYDYDVLGNKIREADADNNQQTWVYSFALGDYSIGRLLSMTVGGFRTTTYAYNGFGQLSAETRPGVNNFCGYTYHDNGLLKQLHDKSQMGPDADGYSKTDAVSAYDYSVKGLVCAERYNRSGEYQWEYEDETGIHTAIGEMPPITRAVHTIYDQRDRVKVVSALPEENPDRDAFTVAYRYDLLGNRLNIRADYVRAGSSDHTISDKWYTYDAEGRMTLVDGGLAGGAIVQDHGTVLTYDGLGRRLTADKFIKADSEAHLEPGFILVTDTWDLFHSEGYGYDDLNHLASVTQQHIFRNRTRQRGDLPAFDLPDAVNPDVFTVETRVHNGRGDLIDCRTFNRLGELQTKTLSFYRDDGQLLRQVRENPDHPDKTVAITNQYDAAGVLTSYQYWQGGNTSGNFTNTYTYRYNTDFGGYKEAKVTVTSNQSGVRPGVTVSKYDAAGQLLTRSTPTNTTGAKRVHAFTYDNDNHITTKWEYVEPFTIGSDFGKQDNTFAQNRLVAILGTGSLDAAQFTNGFTAISSAYPPASAATHVVNSGDTLADIAQLAFGDAAMWFLIADANNLSFAPNDALPTSEIGRTYRIPNVVANLHYDAATFLPYNPAFIIGDLTPTPLVLPPPSEDLALRIFITVAVVAAVVVVSVYTAGAATAVLGSGVLGAVVGGAAGAAAGSAAGQLVAIGLGPQEIGDFSGRQVATAGIAGAAGGFVGAAGGSAGTYFKIANNTYAKVAESYLLSQGADYLVYGSTPDANSFWTLATQVGLHGAADLANVDLNTKNFSWSKAVEQTAAYAINPYSGWVYKDERSRDWGAIINQAVGAFTRVAVTGTVARINQALAPQRTAARARSASLAQYRGSQDFRTQVAASYGLDPSEIILTSGKNDRVQPTMADISEQFSEAERLGWEAVVSNTTKVSRYDWVNGEPVAAQEGLYSGGDNEIDQDILDNPDSELIYITVHNTDDEKSRLPGNANILSEKEFNRLRDFNEYYQPWLDTPANRRPAAPPRAPHDSPLFKRYRSFLYWKIYRPQKRAEYQRQMRDIDNASGSVNKIVAVTGFATSIVSAGVVGTAVSMVGSHSGSKAAEALGFGEDGQLLAGFVGGAVTGGFVSPSTSGRLVPEGFGLGSGPVKAPTSTYRASGPGQRDAYDNWVQTGEDIPFLTAYPNDMPGATVTTVGRGSQLGKMLTRAEETNLENSRSVPARGRAVELEGLADEVPVVVHPSIVRTQHTHQYGLPGPSNKDLRVDVSPAFASDTVHQIVSGPWPNTNWFLQKVGVLPEQVPGSRATVFTYTTGDARALLQREPWRLNED